MKAAMALVLREGERSLDALGRLSIKHLSPVYGGEPILLPFRVLLRLCDFSDFHSIAVKGFGSLVYFISFG